MTPTEQRAGDEVREALRPREQCRLCSAMLKRSEKLEVCRRCELPACAECFYDSIIAVRDEVCDECYDEVGV